jgi:hypothetical protein
MNYKKTTTTTTAPSKSIESLQIVELESAPAASNKPTNTDQTICEYLASKLNGTTGTTTNTTSKNNSMKYFTQFVNIIVLVGASAAIICSFFLVKLSILLNAAEMACVKFSVQLLFCIPFAYYYK